MAIPHLIAAAAVSVVTGYALFALAVHWLFRAPRRRSRRTPADVGLPFENVVIPTGNRRRLRGWLIDQHDGAPLIIVLHGWGNNAECMLPLARPLVGAGFSVLLLDARNHGMSDRDGFSSMVKFAEDLESAYRWAEALSDNPARPVGFIGHSVGGAAALLAASRLPDIGAVVSIGSFAHPAELMRRLLVSRGLRFRPLVRWVLRYVERKIGAAYDDIAPVHTVARLRVPVLLIHGKADRCVPITDAQAIYRSRPGAHVRLLVLPDVGHDPSAALERKEAELVDFLSGALSNTDLTGRNATGFSLSGSDPR